MIYVHVPFCHSKCFYCDFYSTPDLRRMEALTERVVEEYRLRRDELGAAPAPTLYFGGGTPSILPESDFARLAGALFRPGWTEEFTIEVNPEDVTPLKAAFWRSQGVNRVSMGVQSFVDEELKAVNRRHSAKDAINAYRTLRAAGIENISCDLIYGLPGQTVGSFRYSVQTILTLYPEHISAYCLSYEPGTVLSRRLEEERIQAASDELIEGMFGILCRMLADAGYEHYEISNFARPGYRSRHNSAYWTGTPYLGLGPGAHSLDSKGIRRYNPSDIRAYVSSESFPVAIVDMEDETDRLNDCLITALRTADGLDLLTLEPAAREILMKSAAPFLSRGKLTLQGSTLRIPESAWLTSDAILRDLLF